MTAHPEAETRYARGESGYVAYQVFGAGPPILLVSSWHQNLDVMWEEPSMARYLNRLASFGKVICFDKRGSGVSDPVPLNSLPTLEQWIDDARVALDAAGVGQAAVIGDTEGGPMAIVFAATHPERTSALVLVNTFARWRRADDYPVGMPAETTERLVDRYEQNWGVTAEMLQLTAPSVASDQAFRSWYTRYTRLAMPRGAATITYRWVTEIDVRAVLPSIQVPTLVLQREASRHHRPGFGQFLAEAIPGANYVGLPGADTHPINAGNTGPLLDQVAEFVTGAKPERVLDRRLATVVMTDVVGSTRLAAERGDAAWLDLLRKHDDAARELLRAYGGRGIRTTGDGLVALFDGPGRAVTFAARLLDRVRTLGLEIRVGVHTGEFELSGDEIGGLAAHVAARVMGLAADGGVLVSSTVKDLVLGSGIDFMDRGRHTLRGVPGEWSVYEVAAVA